MRRHGGRAACWAARQPGRRGRHHTHRGARPAPAAPARPRRRRRRQPQHVSRSERRGGGCVRPAARRPRPPGPHSRRGRGAAAGAAGSQRQRLIAAQRRPPRLALRPAARRLGCLWQRQRQHQLPAAAPSLPWLGGGRIGGRAPGCARPPPEPRDGAAAADRAPRAGLIHHRGAALAGGACTGWQYWFAASSSSFSALSFAPLRLAHRTALAACARDCRSPLPA